MYALENRTFAILESKADFYIHFKRVFPFLLCRIWHCNIHCLVLTFSKLEHLYEYIDKLQMYSQSSVSVMITALFYIKKLRIAAPDLALNVNCEKKLITTAIIVASKYLDDSSFRLQSWSRMTKIPLDELLQMELEFLNILDHDLYVSPDQLQEWLDQVFSLTLLANQCHPLDYLLVEFKSKAEKKKMDLISIQKKKNKTN